MYNKAIFIPVIYLVLSFYSVVQSTSKEETSNSELNKLDEINILQFGAKGDGTTDDTVALQRAFKKCSDLGLICKIPKDKTFLVTDPLYLWGNASLIGEDEAGVIEFKVLNSPYLLNVGISGQNKLESPFTGVISGVKFKITGGNGGRIIYFWRTNGASILNNIFDVGEYAYSATSSGNNNRWVTNGFKNTVRKNISIIGNSIIASADNKGSEGIGLGHFDGVLISDNSIIGVGDDPIGIHFCKNIKIINNRMKSVDGRLFVVNSKNVEIAYNSHERIRSPANDKIYKGISLLYIGFESSNTNNNLSAPTNIHVHHNYLYYPPDSIDHGAAIYLYGPRNAMIEHNRIVNDSDSVIASAIHLLPARFTGKWSDPDKLDLHNIARVRQIVISNNSSNGLFPQIMKMSGNCVNYEGKVTVKNNMATMFRFYCNTKVDLIGNKNAPK